MQLVGSPSAGAGCGVGWIFEALFSSPPCSPSLAKVRAMWGSTDAHTNRGFSAGGERGGLEITIFHPGPVECCLLA